MALQKCRATTERNPHKQGRARSGSCEERNVGKTNGENQQQIKQVMKQLQAASTIAERGQDPDLQRSLKQAVSMVKDQYYESLPLPQRLVGTQQAIEAKQTKLKQIAEEKKKLQKSLEDLEKQEETTEANLVELKDVLEDIRSKLAEGPIDVDAEEEAPIPKPVPVQEENGELRALVLQLGQSVQTMQKQLQNVTEQMHHTSQEMATMASKMEPSHSPDHAAARSRSQAPRPFQRRVAKNPD